MASLRMSLPPPRPKVVASKSARCLGSPRVALKHRPASFNRGNTAALAATSTTTSTSSIDGGASSNDSSSEPSDPTSRHHAAKSSRHMTWQLFKAALTVPNLRNMFTHAGSHDNSQAAGSSHSNIAINSSSVGAKAALPAPAQQHPGHQGLHKRHGHHPEATNQQLGTSGSGSSGSSGSSGGPSSHAGHNTNVKLQQGLSLLDKTLLQLTYGGGSHYSTVQELVTGLQNVRDSMTVQEWLEFCAAAQQHRLNALMTQQAAASPAAAGNDVASTQASTQASTMQQAVASVPASDDASALHVQQRSSHSPDDASSRASSAAAEHTPAPGPVGPSQAASTYAAAHVSYVPQQNTASSSNSVPADHLLHHQQQQQEQQHAQLQRQVSNGSSAPARLPTYDHLVFSGGGARCLAYAGAVHRLRQLGMLPRLRSVSGASGGAVFALLAALQCEPAEVLDMMEGLPERESISWFGLNARMGLTQGEATFGAITQAIAKKLGIEHPTLRDVANHKGIQVALAATSLSQRAPVYLSSSTHGDLAVYDALRMSCAIPLYFSPVRLGSDLLVDGCLTDCTPINGLGPNVDLARVLVLTVNDEQHLDVDFQGMLHGLVATCLQAGWHRQKGVDLINLWSSAAGVHPLQFRVPEAQARDVITRSASIAEEFAALKTKASACRSAGGACSEGGACDLPTAHINEITAAPALVVMPSAPETLIAAIAGDNNGSNRRQSRGSTRSGHSSRSCSPAHTTGTSSSSNSSGGLPDLAGFGSGELEPGCWDESVLLG